ncbi:hypothetical protein HY442_00750 [Candidatus Parcubacteria bacterium]|nr:hypothetical protein [Candidatus Parcubacteria bacterium]
MHISQAVLKTGCAAFVLGLVLFVMLGFIQPVFAQAPDGVGQNPPVPPGTGQSVRIPNFLAFDTIQAVINAVIPKLIILATVIVAPMIIWAAYMLMFSPASPDLINKAKTTLLWTLVGYAIILVGSGIAYIVSEILGVPTG